MPDAGAGENPVVPAKSDDKTDAIKAPRSKQRGMHPLLGSTLREDYRERRPFSGGRCDFYFTIMVPGNFSCDGEAESRPPVSDLVVKKGSKILLMISGGIPSRYR